MTETFDELADEYRLLTNREILTILDEKKKTRTKPFSFGVSYLDDCLGGIESSDVILIGAKTGIGKSQLVANIAQHNAMIGKKVALFALEAELGEIQERIRYRIFCDLFYKSNNHYKTPPVQLSYRNYRAGLLDEFFEEYREDVNTFFEVSLNGLRTYYRKSSFTVEDFTKRALSQAKDCDIFILDHLHFLDFDEPNENKALKDITKQIRELALVLNKPVIVVAHLRKEERKSKALINTIEDFHGSSDVAKMATKVIVMSPAYEITPSAKHKHPTFIRAVKNRFDSTSTVYTGLCEYDVVINEYSKKYAIGKMKNANEEFHIILNKADAPYWAERASYESKIRYVQPHGA